METIQTTQKLRAYHGDPKLKAALVREIEKHRKYDQIVQGNYGDAEENTRAFRGCAIGCALHSLNLLEGKVGVSTSDHTRFPSELEWPIELAYHIDHVFENLPRADAVKWPGQMARAIQPGADLSGVTPQLLQWQILDAKWGWIALAENAEERAAFRELAALVQQDWVTNPDSVTTAQWDAIDQKLAWAGAWARARAWAGAWARARAGAWARARAWAWAWAGAWAWAEAYQALSKQTLKLLKAAR